MPGVAGPNLGVKFGWIDHENGWGGDMNVNLRGLDDLVQLAVVDKDLATPPGSPTEGQRYIVAASPTGAWVGHAGQIARWFSGGWIFYAPKEGWRAWVSDEDLLYGFNGTTWGTTGGGGSGFAVLAGQAGGQTLYGGTAAGENLILGSTAHATKGKIQFGASSAYDEANVRLGIGTLSPQAGLHVGVNSHSGGTSVDGVIEGRLLMGDNIASTGFTSGQAMTVLQNAVTGGTMLQFTYNLAALSGAASGVLTTIKAGFAGTPGWTSGTASILRGFGFTPILTVPSGVTVTDFIGAHVDLTFGTTSPQGTVTNWVGYRAELRGGTTNGPAVTSVIGFQSSPGWRGAMTPTGVYGFQATKLSTVTYGSTANSVTAAYGFYVDSTFAASAAVTTWYGFYCPTMSGPGTIWGFYQAGTMNSASGGKTRFGSTAAPSHWIDIAAGTTTVAFMRPARGPL